MSIEKHFISIIIPAYNAEKTLSKCLQSVFASSYTQFECIIVDDHSNDNSAAVGESFDTKIIRLDRQRGPAYARNKGAETAKGDILLFLDADITIYPDSLDKIIKTFQDNKDIAALFGSYDDKPACTNFFSQYKNLFHHYVHQISRDNASTFWSGFGAIKKDVFVKAGVFDQNRYSNPSIEDIELGSRLVQMGCRILLCKNIQVKHLKRWTFLSLMRADILYRAVPWSRLIIERKQLISDLNLQISDRISAVLVCLSVVMLLFLPAFPQLIYLILLLLSGVFALNYRMFGFFFKNKGMIFTVLVFMMHLFYYLYSAATFVLCWLLYMLPGKKVAFEPGSGTIRK